MAIPNKNPVSEFDNIEYSKAKKELKKLYPTLDDKDADKSDLHILDRTSERKNETTNTPLSPLLSTKREGDNMFGILQELSSTGDNLKEYVYSRKNLEKSIKGLEGLSDEEFNKWRLDNWDIAKGKSYQELEDIYWNQAYDALNRYRLSKSPDAQQTITSELMSGKSPKELFIEDQVNKGTFDFRNSISNVNHQMQFDNLSPEHKLEVANSYISDDNIAAIAREYVENGKLIEDLDPGFWGQMGYLGETLGKSIAAGLLVGPLGAAAMGLGASGHYSKDPLISSIKSEREDMVGQYISDLEDRNEKIIEQAVQKDTEEKININSKTINNNTIAATKAFYEGKISTADIDEAFTKITEQSPYYKAFKDESEFSSFDYADKIRTIVQYSTIAQNAGETAAFNAMNRDMQNWVDEHQTVGDNLLNCLVKGFWCEAASSTASSLIGILSIFKDENFLKGKDAEGNDLPFLLDINYWNGVSQYNTLLPSLIDEIEANGGISPHVNVTAYGEELDFISWDAVGQAIEQSGQFAGMAANKGFAKIIKAPIKYPLNRVVKNSGLIRIGRGVDQLTDLAWVSAGPAMKEAFEGYQNTKEAATREIDAMKEKDYLEAMREVDNSFDWEISMGELDLYVENLRKLEENKNKKDKELYDLAIKDISEKKQKDRDALAQRIKTQLDNKYSEDYGKAEDAASTAYKTAFGINLLKTGITNATSRKWLFNNKSVDAIKKSVGYKGKNKPFDPDKKTFDELSKLDKTKAVLGHTAKTFKSEALDEGADYLINQYGYHTGMSEFDNYIADKYSTSNYITGAHGITGILSNLGKTYNHLEDRELWYEAFLGGLGGVINFTPNPDIIRRGFSTYTNAEKFLKKKGVKVELSTIEKLNRWVNNGIISSIAEDDAEIKDRRRVAGLVSDLLKDNKDLEHVLGLIGSAVEEVDAKQNKGVKELKDARLNSAIKLAYALHDAKSFLEDADMEYTPYENILNEIKELASGNVSEEMINKFLATPENKDFAVLDNNGNFTEETINKVKERIIHNATKLDEIITKVNTTYRKEAEELADTENIPDDVRDDYINTYIQIKAKMDDTSERINSLNKELSLSESTYIHSEQYIRSKNKVSEDTKTILQEAISKSTKKIEELKSKLKKTFRSNSRQKLKRDIELEQFKIDKYNLEISKLDDYTSEDSQTASEITKDVLSNLPKEEVLFIVNPKNLHLFNKKEQKEIQKFIKEKLSQDPDYFTKLKDLSVLTEEYDAMSEGIDNFASNKEFLVDYINSYRQKRINEYLKITKELLYENFNTYLQTLQKKNPSLARAFLKEKGTSNFLTRFIEENPEEGKAYESLLDIITTKEDIISILNTLETPAELKSAIREVIHNKLKRSNSREDLLKKLEVIAQSEDSSAPIFNDILTQLESIGYTRNATVIESANKKRKRKKKQEEKRKKEEEKKKKLEEEKKKEEDITITEDITIPSEEPTEETTEVEKEVTVTKDLGISTTESPTIEEQVASVEEEHKDKVKLISVNNEDVSPVDPVQSSEILGNAIFEYEAAAASEGVQKKRTGKEKDDKMSKFFNWTKAAGFTIQKTIDEELNRIAKTNPDVMFMTVNPVNNATKDSDVEGHIFTVVEYTPEIKSIHREEDGNVITSGDKKYLVIGTSGYNSSNFTQSNLAKFVYSSMLNFSKLFFSRNTGQRFYVNPKLKTKIAGIDRGWIVNQLEDDESVKLRSIIELINDPNPRRNPKKLKIEDLKWRIQIGDKAADINVSEDDVVGGFKDVDAQNGRVFLLLEASNGKYIPVAVRPIIFNEIKDGELKETILELAYKLGSGNTAEMKKAVAQLRTKLAFTKEKKLEVNGTIIDEYYNGKIVRSFDTSSDTFSVNDLLNVLNSFRVNVTASSLTNKASINALAEAGALNLDIATLATSNAGYRIYGIDPDTKQPIIPSDSNSTHSVDTGSDKFIIKDQVIIHNGTRYEARESGFYSKGELVRDPYLIEMLKIESIISNTNPTTVKRDTEYYVLKYNNGNTFMVARNTKTGHVVKVQSSTKDRIIKDVKEEELKRNAAEELKAIEQQQKTQDQITVADESSITLLGDIFEDDTFLETEEEIKPSTQEVTEDIKRNKSLEEIKEDANTLDTVEKIINDAIFGEELDAIIDEKVSSGEWPSINSVNELMSLLEGKGMPIVGIENVSQWLDIIKNCK